MTQPFDLQPLLDDIIAWAKNQPEILAVYLYGSHAEGRANALSDVDIALLLRADLARETIWALERKWDVIWSETIDLQILNDAPLPFRYQATALGKRLWAVDVNLVAETESLIWRLYWDFKPRLDEAWAIYVEQMMEQKSETERREYEASLEKVGAVHRRVRAAAANRDTSTEE